MLGHRLWLDICERNDVGGSVATRDGSDAMARWPDIFDAASTVAVDDLTGDGAVDRLLDAVRPTAVINALGIVKQRYESVTPVEARSVNTDLPHQVAAACVARGVRMIHVSTDCVFSGTGRGPWAEHDPADPVDAYGVDKLAGEPEGPGILTIRTSLIGRELVRSSGLVEWLIDQDGTTIRGFRDAWFSGLSSATLARILVDLALASRPSAGVFHIAAEPIDKDRLLRGLVRHLGLDIEIEAVDRPHIDRALDGQRFRDATGVVVPHWETMLAEIADESGRYQRWRD